MRGLVVLAILFALWSGCLGPSGDSSRGGGLDPLGGGIAFRSSVLDPTRGVYEPALAVAPDGSIFVCGPGHVGFGTDVWVSTDGGASFQYSGNQVKTGVPVLPHDPVVRSGSGDVGGGDCDMGADAGGRVYLADLWLGSVSVSSTTDKGASWRGVPVSIVGAPLDRPWVLGGDKDEVFLTAAQLQGFGYEERGLNTPPVGGIWVARSTDGGMTFPQRVLAVGNQDRIGLNSNLARDGDFLYVMYTKKVAEGRIAVTVAVSKDRGVTWEQHVAAEQDFYPRQCEPLNLFPSVAADGAGGVYLAWAMENPKTQRIDLFLASSRDHGVTWNAPVSVADRPGTRAFPWVAAQAPGRVGLVWYESNDTLLTHVENVQCLDNATSDTAWRIHYASSQDALDAAPRFSETLVQAAPIHQGVLDRPYAEVLQVRFTPDGRAVTAYVADVAEGTARPMFAVQASGSD